MLTPSSGGFYKINESKKSNAFIRSHFFQLKSSLTLVPIHIEEMERLMFGVVLSRFKNAKRKAHKVYKSSQTFGILNSSVTVWPKNMLNIKKNPRVFRLLSCPCLLECSYLKIIQLIFLVLQYGSLSPVKNGIAHMNIR